MWSLWLETSHVVWLLTRYWPGQTPILQLTGQLLLNISGAPPLGFPTPQSTDRAGRVVGFPFWIISKRRGWQFAVGWWYLDYVPAVTWPYYLVVHCLHDADAWPWIARKSTWLISPVTCRWNILATPEKCMLTQLWRRFELLITDLLHGSLYFWLFGSHSVPCHSPWVFWCLFPFKGRHFIVKRETHFLSKILKPTIYLCDRYLVQQYWHVSCPRNERLNHGNWRHRLVTHVWKHGCQAGQRTKRKKAIVMFKSQSILQVSANAPTSWVLGQLTMA